MQTPRHQESTPVSCHWRSSVDWKWWIVNTYSLRLIRTGKDFSKNQFQCRANLATVVPYWLLLTGSWHTNRNLSNQWIPSRTCITKIVKILQRREPPFRLILSNATFVSLVMLILCSTTEKSNGTWFCFYFADLERAPRPISLSQCLWFPIHYWQACLGQVIQWDAHSWKFNVLSLNRHNILTA